MGSIRSAVTSDLSALLPLFLNYLTFYQVEVSRNQAEAFLRERLFNRDSCLLVALDGPVICGFIQLYPSFSTLTLSSHYILHDLYVVPGSRRQSVAKKLIQAALASHSSHPKVSWSLQTARDNFAAQRLYENLGWRKDQDFYTYEYPAP